MEHENKPGRELGTLILNVFKWSGHHHAKLSCNCDVNYTYIDNDNLDFFYAKFVVYVKKSKLKIFLLILNIVKRCVIAKTITKIIVITYNLFIDSLN